MLPGSFCIGEEKGNNHCMWYLNKPKGDNKIIENFYWEFKILTMSLQGPRGTDHEGFMNHQTKTLYLWIKLNIGRKC